jgi:hypothetical protein
MDIGKSFVDSWNIYIKNFIILLLALIVAGVLGCITLGLLAIPLIVGFQLMFVNAKRGKAIAFNDLFVPIGNFFKLFFGAIWIAILILLVLLPGIICLVMKWNVIGGILLAAGVLFDIYLGVNWIFALLLIQDKGLSINNALKTSRGIVSKNNWWLHLLLIILVGLVGQIGGVAWGVCGDAERHWRSILAWAGRPFGTCRLPPLLLTRREVRGCGF